MTHLILLDYGAIVKKIRSQSSKYIYIPFIKRRSFEIIYRLLKILRVIKEFGYKYILLDNL